MKNYLLFYSYKVVSGNANIGLLAPYISLLTHLYIPSDDLFPFFKVSQITWSACGQKVEHSNDSKSKWSIPN